MYECGSPGGSCNLNGVNRHAVATVCDHARPARVADQDQRHAVERPARHVDPPGDPQVSLVEALRAVPREVRVAEHHAAAVVGGLAPEPVGIRADLRLKPAETFPGGEHLRPLLVTSLGRRGRHGRSAHDPVDDRARAGQDAELEEAPVHVDRLDRPDPLLAAAGRVGDPVAASVLQVLVVAPHVTADAAAHLGRRAVGRLLRDQLLDHLPLLHPLEVEVGVEVPVRRPVAGEEPRLVRPEEARALGIHRHVLGGDGADVVLRERVCEPGGQALHVLRRDVRHAELRALDLRLERLGVGGSTAGCEEENG